MSGETQQRPRHLGTLLRRVREASGLTRRDLAAQAQITYADVRNVESGRRRPSRGTLDRILRVPAIAGALAWSGLVSLAAREGIPIDLAPEPAPEA